ncbi:sensor histidine kinase [Actinopolymorpha alba]|uniref:sensor histidine kinase n=1 Tax=Actinopolymorpha alba TaxID=533267 RepID=UPI00036F136A|nr:sensor histidine kinase [Actinopolymorpha alba]
MLQKQQSVSRLDAWERREMPVYRALPYVLLALSVIVTVFQPIPSTAYLVGVLCVSAVTIGWIFFFVTLRPVRVERPRLAGIYLAGLLVCAGVLVAMAPWFGIFAWVGYIHATVFLPGRWSYAGIAGTGTITAFSQTGSIFEPTAAWLGTYLALVAVNVLLASTMGFFALVASEQGEKRKKTIEELAEANSRLTAMMRENAGLHAQLVAQAREAGIHDERQRMAQEIHDTLAQGLTGIITQLEASGQAGDDPSERQRHLDAAMRLARESLSEARRSVHALRPEALDAGHLPDALAEVVERWAEVNGVAAQVTTTGNPRPLHPEVEVALLRTAQEGLANVAKHANASRVGLTLSYMEDVVTLDVRDDGVGFDPERQPAAPDRDGGFGLIAMRQRVHRLAGRLEIESEPGGGTAISASLPAIAAGGVG